MLSDFHVPENFSEWKRLEHDSLGFVGLVNPNTLGCEFLLQHGEIHSRHFAAMSREPDRFLGAGH